MLIYYECVNLIENLIVFVGIRLNRWILEIFFKIFFNEKIL